MAPITHSKVSVIADGDDTTLVRPSDWNADHAGSIAHADTTGQTANDHHNQSHNHSAAGDGTTLTPATLNIPNAAAPTPTAEGQAVWDNDDDKLVVGDGVGQKHILPSASISGDATMSTAGAVTVAGTHAGSAHHTRAHGMDGASDHSAGTLGDLIYAAIAGAWTRLTGNTTTTRKFLRQTGDGAASAAPAWDTLVDGDIPTTLTAVTNHAAAADPHTGYRLESADHNHASSGAQAGQVAHSALSGTTATDHHSNANDHARSHDHSAAGDGTALAPATLTFPGAVTPAQTAEGSAVWDTDNDVLTVGDGTGRKTLLDKDTLTAKGDIYVATAAGAVSRLAVGATNGHVLTVDSAEATGLKYAAAAGGSGALTRVGGNTTEATTTSTSAVDLLTVSSLAITPGTPFMAIASFAKNAGAGNNALVGVKLNATNVRSTIGATSTIARAEDGVWQIVVGPRSATYLAPGIFFLYCAQGGITNTTTFADGNTPGASNVTDVILTGRVNDGLITLSADDMHIYTYATS